MSESGGFEVPARALVLQGNRTLIPVLDDKNHIHYRPVRIAGNDGQKLRISEGVQPGERIALSIGNTVNEGDLVQVRPNQMAGKAAPIVQSQN